MYSSDGKDDDSLHAGLNEGLVETADRIDTRKGWKWTKATLDGPDATVNISSTGIHTVNIYMREDGCTADKIVLTTNSGYTPSGEGPPESPRG